MAYIAIRAINEGDIPQWGVEVELEME